MSIKLLSWNVNGMRSIARQGFADWFTQQRADVVLLQEIKARITTRFGHASPMPGTATSAGVSIISWRTRILARGCVLPPISRRSWVRTIARFRSLCRASAADFKQIRVRAQAEFVLQNAGVKTHVRPSHARTTQGTNVFSHLIIQFGRIDQA